MKKFLAITCSAICFALAFSNVHAGAAICIAKDKTPKNNDTDVQYFTRWGGSDNGYQAEKQARQDYSRKYSKGYPSCRSTGRMVHGHFVVIANTMKNYAKERRTTYAFGYGATRSEAEKDAVKEMGRRNWSWKKRDGYKIVESRQF